MNAIPVISETNEVDFYDSAVSAISTADKKRNQARVL